MSDQPNFVSSSHSITPMIDIAVYLRLIWRWSWLVLLCVLVAGTTAFIVSRNTTPIYQASSQLMISAGTSDEDRNYWFDADRTARTLSQVIANPTHRKTAMEILGLDESVGALSISAQVIRDTDLLNLSVSGTSPELVAAVANVLPQVVSTDMRRVQSERFAESKASLQEQLDEVSTRIEVAELALAEIQDARTVLEALELGRLQSTLDRHHDSYAYLLESYETLRLTEAQALDSLVIIEPATIPSTPIRPRTSTNVLLAMIVGGLLAMGSIFLVEFFDRRIRTPDDLKRVTSLPMLGSIMEFTSGKAANGEAPSIDLISATDPRNPMVESYRRLRTNLQYYNVDRGLHTLAVTSANPGEGKSATAANLAIVLAQSGKHVVLVDTDLRRPRIHKMFDLPRKPGLSEVLASGLPPDASLASIGPTPAPGIPNLSVLQAGGKAPNPAELLDSQRMRALINYLKQVTDIVVFDSPPLQAVTDAQLIGRLVDGTILVVNSRETSGVALQNAIGMMEQVNAPVWGVVLNRLPKSGRGYYYYYSDKVYSDSAESEEPKTASNPGQPPGEQRETDKEASREHGLPAGT